jgi:SAM-dependent methyltransferase
MTGGRLQAWVRRQNFKPGRLGWLINPFYFARRELRRAMEELLPRLHGEVLDVGCGNMPYRDLARVDRYVGLDYDSPLRREAGAADLFYAGGRFPLSDASFDGALCTQVLEHVFTPDEFLGEIGRVLRPGGLLILTVPFVWDEHEQPHDFARYSSFGLRSILESAGFEVIEHRKTLADARVLFQLINAYLFKVTQTRTQRFNHLIALLLMAPINLVGIVVGLVAPKNVDFYLDNVVVARKRSIE